MNRRGGTGKVVYFIDLDIKRESNVVAHRLKTGVVYEMCDVVLSSGEVIIDAQDVIPGFYEAFAKVRAEKTRSAGYQNPLHYPVLNNQF